jgi:hypothetical protein
VSEIKWENLKDNYQTFKKKSNTILHFLSLANMCQILYNTFFYWLMSAVINKHVVIKESSVNEPPYWILKI